MSAIIFCGPTIAREEVEKIIPSALMLPPASQGDIYLATKSGPTVIALIDGLFERVASVWHKEILWALSQGITVFGSSSMGALRAAELDSFGMIGVGKIYRKYTTSEIEDDDEVAIMHAPKELGFLKLSEALVNIRATLAYALYNGVITSTVEMLLLKIAKEMYYPHRTFENILSSARAFVPSPQLTDLSEWLPFNKIDQKKDDAIELLHQVNRHINHHFRFNSKTQSNFVRTLHWTRMVAELEEANSNFPHVCSA